MNKSYWDNYYAKTIGIETPSTFASYVSDLMKKGESILELGCGNGRDSFYFAKKGFHVFAIDQSKIVINRIKKKNINAFHYSTLLPIDCVFVVLLQS